MLQKIGRAAHAPQATVKHEARGALGHHGDSASAPMPTIGLCRLLTPGPSSSPLRSDTRRISPWRPEPRRRLAAGLAAVGSVVLLLGMGAPRARAYDGEVRRACQKASRLLQPRAFVERTATQVKDRNRRWCVCDEHPRGIELIGGDSGEWLC